MAAQCCISRRVKRWGSVSFREKTGEAFVRGHESYRPKPNAENWTLATLLSHTYVSSFSVISLTSLTPKAADLGEVT